VKWKGNITGSRWIALLQYIPVIKFSFPTAAYTHTLTATIIFICYWDSTCEFTFRWGSGQALLRYSDKCLHSYTLLDSNGGFFFLRFCRFVNARDINRLHRPSRWEQQATREHIYLPYYAATPIFVNFGRCEIFMSLCSQVCSAQLLNRFQLNLV
jgi:hypothetical protein